MSTLYHGTSLSIKGIGVLLRGPSGSGKSDLALRLIHRGALLIADDQVEIFSKEQQLVARCPRNIQGKLEVRGVDIIEVPFIKEHPLQCLIDLVPPQEIERLPESLAFENIQNISLPLYRLTPFEGSAPDKLFVIMKLFSENKK